MSTSLTVPCPPSASELPHRRRRRLLAAATALGLVLAATTAVAPASAHDELVASTPTPDQALDPAPSEITLTFSDNILEVGTEISVTDAAGTEFVADEPVVDGPTVSVALESEMPGGSYDANWRVVSSDGHPISGTIPFSVTTPAETSTPSPSANAEESEPPVATPGDDATTDVDDATATSDDGRPSGGQIALIAGIVLAALVVIASVLLIIARRRGAAADAASGRSPGDDA